MVMKKILVTLTFALAALNLVAQRVKYKDLFPQMMDMSNSELKNSLKEYIADDREHPNANFRFALAYEYSYKTADLLTEYDYARANAEQAQLRFLKAKQLVDDHEVSRNNEYYFAEFKTFDAKGRPNVEFPIVQMRMTSGYDSAILFLSKISPIYKNFTRSVNSYDHAVKVFAAINKDFLSLDDLYLYYDTEMASRLSDLRTSYDSAKLYFDKYSELIKEFPIAYHKQKYTIKPIVTYRLDGLITRMNFLTNNVEFWDYGTWVDQINKSVTSEIASLRTRLIQNEERLDETLATIAASTGEGITPVKLDKQLVFNLNNYDKQSLVLGLLDFKAFKQGWLIQTKILQPDTVSRERNAGIYSTLIYSNRSADTLIDVVRDRLNPEKIRKHKDFLVKYYGNIEGVKRYATVEKENIKKTFEGYKTSLRAELTGLAMPVLTADVNKAVRFGRFMISSTIMLVTPELLEKGEPITLQNKKSPDGSVYLAGIYKPDKKVNNLVTFVARIGADGKPAWIKNFDFKIDSLSATPDANNFLGPLDLTQEGCVFLVHAIKLTDSNSLNRFVYLNEKGEEKFKIRLKNNSFPRKLNYNEKSNSFIIVMKGKAEKQVYSESEPVTVMSINILGDPLWTRTIDLTGTVSDLININAGYLVIGNFMVIKDLSGKEFRTRINAGESNPFMIKFNEQGDLTKIAPIPVTKSVFIVKVIKLNDNAINLIGWEGTLESGMDKTLSPSDPIIYLMTNHLCQVVCSIL
jgi:hypothetical protein